MTQTRLTLMFALAMVTTPALAQSDAPQAQAQAQAQISVGASVVGPEGAPVGTVTSVGSDFVTIKTDKYEVRLPKTALGARPDGWAVGLTQAELNASIEKSLGSLDALLKPGTAVAGAQGAAVGTVEAVEGDLVTLKLTSGKLVRLPKSGFAPGPNGLVIGLTAQQLEAEAPSGN